MPFAAAPAAAEPSLQTTVDAALDRRLDAESQAPVALALSGGGDSMALLGLTIAWTRARGRPLIAFNVDHRINLSSGDWTRAAAEAAGRAGAGFAALDWTGPKPGAGLPAAARAARHALLATAARKAGARVLLTGHTLDDVLEGERMRAQDTPGLGRLREWSPSPAWPEGRGLFLLRPLLGLRREALRDWLRARRETWIEDPANADPRFARSRARSFLASPSGAAQQGPEGEGSSSPPPRMELSITPDGRILVRRDRIDAHLLSAALLCAAGTGQPPRGVQLARLLERLAGAAPVDATLAGARLVADGDVVQIGRDAGERFRGGLAPLALSPGEVAVWDGRFELTAGAPGLCVQPLGGVIARLGHRDRARLKAIPPWARGAIPALVSPDGAVSLPRPLGEGPAAATPLAGARLAAALGSVARESDLVDRAHGAGDLLILC
ncbi:MAG: tRNA lysidine(34) synthetase TilS [Caulobacterales bacterium 32-69-10]|nr:MAG: tRNA lysidine(34) synthetase TilS [Caulobacterales bacterium 32-69-10]